MSNWLIFAILAAFSWGLYAVFIKKSYESAKAATGVVLGAVAALLLLLPFSIAKGAEFIFWPLIPIGALAAASYIFIYYAFEKGKISLMAPVQSTYPLFTVVLAAIFLGETTNLSAKLALVPVILGLILVSSESPRRLLKTGFGNWFWWALGAAALAGFGDFLAKLMVNKYDPYTYSLAFVFGWVIVAGIIAVFGRKNISLRINKGNKYLLLGNLFLFAGYLFFYLAFETGLASIVTPITAAYSAVALFLSIIWLKEKITTWQLVGVVMTILGVIMISRG